MKTRKEFTTDAETVERVLAGLKQAAPSPSMNGRIMRALRQRDLAEIQTQRRAKRGAQAGWAVSAICAAALVITVIAFLPKAPSGAHATPVSPSLIGQPSPPRQLASAPEQHSVPVTRRATAQNTPRNSLGRHRQLLVEAHARSRPAPPAPLTEQEKLLVELAATGDRNRTDLLNPQVQQQQQTEAKAEFDSFFKADRSGDSE